MSQHTLVHQVVRPAVLLVAKFPKVTPNHLTAARYAAGCLAAGCFAWGSPRALAMGGLLFLASFLLDRADGALARLTGRFSRSGRMLDAWADGSADMFAFLALGLAAYWHGASPLPLACGAIAAIATAAACWGVASADAGRAATLRRPFDPDDALLAIPAIAWLGAASEWDPITPFLVLASAGSAAFALWTLRGLRIEGSRKPAQRNPVTVSASR